MVEGVGREVVGKVFDALAIRVAYDGAVCERAKVRRLVHQAREVHDGARSTGCSSVCSPGQSGSTRRTIPGQGILQFLLPRGTKAFSKLLPENSAIAGELDKALGLFTGIVRLREEQRPSSDKWNRSVTERYFETLILAKKVASTMEARTFRLPSFLAF